MPPSSSALDWNRVPQRLPTFTPMQESRKVVAAMKHTAGRMDTSKKAKVMPTARASMLVATAMGSITRKAREALVSSSSGTTRASRDPCSMPAGQQGKGRIRRGPAA